MNILNWPQISSVKRIVFVVIMAFGLVAFFSWPNWYSIVFGSHTNINLIEKADCDDGSNLDKGSLALRSNLLDRINYDLDDWSKDKDRNKFGYFLMSIFMTLSTMVITLLVALREGKMLSSWRFWPIILVGLPAITASVSASLEQFKLREIWGIRIDGIYELELISADFMLTGCKSDKLPGINERLSQLEQRQSALNNIMGQQPTPNRKN